MCEKRYLLPLLTGDLVKLKGQLLKVRISLVDSKDFLL